MLPVTLLPETVTEGRALARAALAGNPSDGFGGAVLAVVVPGLETTVRVEPAPEPLVGAPSGEVAVPVADNDLVGAAAQRLLAWLDETGAGRPRTPDLAVALRSRTSIPRSVGLGGSSALVIAALRALAARWGVAVDLLTTARLALQVEVDLLGITAGPQDRLVQAAGRAVLMDFGGADWIVTPVDPPEPVELIVVWSAASAAPSGAVHAPLAARRSDPAVARAMTRLGALARDGAAALAGGDRAALAAAMVGSYEQRAAILDLDPTHVALVDGARAAGVGVNYAGSGGAVVGLGDPGSLDAAAAWATGAGLGFHRFTVPA
jgi:glucuronokinase